MIIDELSYDTPSSILDPEVETLRSMVVGEIRTSVLMAALPVDVEWVCVKVEKTRWGFEARFCGQLLMAVEICKGKDGLKMESVNV